MRESFRRFPWGAEYKLGNEHSEAYFDARFWGLKIADFRRGGLGLRHVIFYEFDHRQMDL